MNHLKWYIVSYLNDAETTAGGVRLSRLNMYLNNAGYQSILITRNAVNENEISIPESKYSKIPFVNAVSIPDFGVFWVNRVIKFFSNKNKFILLTTSPLHSIHKVGLKLKKQKKDFIWIADFRDPFTLNALYNPLNHKKSLDKSYEIKVMQSADVLIFNTKTHKKLYKKHYSWLDIKKSLVVRNGYDIFTSIKTKPRENKIIYSGGIYKGVAVTGTGNFFREITSLGLNISCDFIGEDSPEFKNYTDVLHYKGNFDSGEVPEILSRYKYGLVYLPTKFKESGTVASKLYDYIGAGLIPVCINPSIEMTKIVNELGYGIIIDEFDTSAYINFINFIKFSPRINFKPQLILKHSRNYQFDILLNFMKKNYS